LTPWLHNASVIVGLKQRGLCYQYQEDLYDGLKPVHSEHLALHFIEANKGRLNEHHALALVAKGAKWDSGLVLDAWRANGNLYFGPLKTDKYPWLHEPLADVDGEPAPSAP